MPVRTVLASILLYVAGVDLRSEVSETWKFTFDGPYSYSDIYPIGIGTDVAGNIYVGANIVDASDQDQIHAYTADGQHRWVFRQRAGSEGYNTHTVFLSADQNTYLAYAHGNHISVTRVDPEGRALWQREFDDGFQEVDLAAAAPLPGGGFVLVSQEHWRNRSEFLTSAYDHDGSLQWSSRFTLGDVMPTTPGDARASKVLADEEGGVWVAASSTVAGIVTLRYTSAGKLLWATPLADGLNRRESGYAQDMQMDSSGSVLVCGSLRREDPYESHGLLLKVSGDGKLLWEKHYNGPGLQREDTSLELMDIDAGGRITVVGNAWLNLSAYSIVAVNYSSDGELVWEVLPAGQQHSHVAGVDLDSSGNVYIAGTVYTQDGAVVATLLKYSPGGELIWSSKVLAAEEEPRPFGLVVTTDAIHVSGVVGAEYSESLFSEAHAPDGRVLWRAEEKFSNADGDEVRSIGVNAGGKIAVGGSVSALEEPYEQRLVIVVDENGQMSWSSSTSPESQQATMSAVAMDASGQVVVAGTERYCTDCDRPFGGAEFVTVKYDPLGKEIWTRKHAPEGEWVAKQLFLDPAGNVHVAGTAYHSHSFDGEWAYSSNLAAIKLDSNGEVLWDTEFDTHGTEGTTAAMTVDPAGAVYLAGVVEEDYVTLKLDSTGRLLWAAWQEGAARDRKEPCAIAVDGHGSVHVAGTTGIDETAFLALKYDDAGNMQWSAAYKAEDALLNTAIGMALAPDGGVIVAGTSVSSSTQEDFTTVKFAPDGSLSWAARYDGPLHQKDSAGAMTIDAAGNVYLAGVSQGQASVGDIVLVMYDHEGRLRDDYRRESAPSVRFEPGVRAVTVDGTGSVYLAGEEDSDFLLLKLAVRSESRFRRGDVDADGHWRISDPVRMLRHLLQGGAGVPCLDAADADDSGQVQITDALYLLGYLFLGSGEPPPPFPECGVDPTADEVECGGEGCSGD